MEIHSVLALKRIALRPLALPAEHGSWGLLLEPILLALLVAPSGAGLLIAFGALFAFLSRHPLKLAAHDWLQKRYPRTDVCEALAAAYGAAALIAFTASAMMAGAVVVVPLLIALPFAAIQFTYDTRKRGRSLIAEIAGAIAPATIAASIALAAGKSAAIGAALSALMIARSVPAVLYVRSVLRGEPRAPMLVAHAAAVILALMMGNIGAIAAMLLLLGRALPRVEDARPQQIGFREIGWGLCVVMLIAPTT